MRVSFWLNDPLVTKVLLSLGKVVLSESNFWIEYCWFFVVRYNISWLEGLVFPNPTVSSLGLSLLETLERGLDLLVSAKVWHEVVSGWWISWLGSPVWAVIQLLLRGRDTVQSLSDLLVLAKVWHGIVDWEAVSEWCVTLAFVVPSHRSKRTEVGIILDGNGSR